MRRIGFRGAVLATTMLLIATLAGCSFRSFSHSSRSSSSPSRSSSRSSRPADQAVQAEQAGFHEEVSALAVLYVGSGGSAEEFEREIAAAGERNGLRYWEADPGAFAAIGKGLRRAGVKREEIPYIPFLDGLRDSPHFGAIQRGYGN